MDTGREFLRAQVNNTITLHKSLIESIEDHARQADEQPYRDLCQHWIPRLQRHQTMIEEYGRMIGADAKGSIKQTLGAVLAKARDTVDAMRETDFLRVVGDIVMARQAQDTFETFAAVGERIGEPKLSDIGRTCGAEHDTMQHEFNQFARDLFVDHVMGAVAAR